MKNNEIEKEVEISFKMPAKNWEVFENSDIWKNFLYILAAVTLLEKKNIHPTHEEMQEYTKFVIEHLFK